MRCGAVRLNVCECAIFMKVMGQYLRMKLSGCLALSVTRESRAVTPSVAE